MRESRTLHQIFTEIQRCFTRNMELLFCRPLQFKAAFLPLLFGLWRARDLQERTEHFRFFEGHLPATSILNELLLFKNKVWYCLNYGYSWLWVEQWLVAWLEARAQSETVIGVCAQAILCHHEPITHAHNTPMKLKCGGKRILPYGFSPCFLIAFLDHSVVQSEL